MTSLDDTTLLAYVDGELDEVTARAVEVALQDNPAALRKVRLLRESATLVRAAVNEPVHGPTPLRLTRVLTGSGPTPGLGWPRRRWLVVATAAMLIAAVFAGGFLAGRLVPPTEPRLAGGEDLVDEILAYHAFYAELPPGGITDRPDRALMEAWLSRHLRGTVRIPDLSTQGFEFDTARLFVSGGRPVAQIVYESSASAPIALCIVPAAKGEALDLTATQRQGFTLVTWQRAGYLYFVVGAAPEALLRDLSAEISAALTPA